MLSKTQAAFLSIVSNFGLVTLKLGIGILTGAVSIISEAIHSATDLLASLIAFFSVRSSDKPADKEHPYGHGKVENVSGVIEAILILGAAIWIIIESISKIIHPHQLETGLFVWGFLIMIISATVNILVSRILYKVAKREESIALTADALHLKADVITSIGVGIGLGIIWIMHNFDISIEIIDPIIAILVALFILKEAIEILQKAFEPLLDHSLPSDEMKIIVEVLNGFKVHESNFHDLRARRSGKFRHIDFHLTVPPKITVKEAHDLCDEIEKSLESQLPNSMVLIHVEPEGAD